MFTDKWQAFFTIWVRNNDKIEGIDYVVINRLGAQVPTAVAEGRSPEKSSVRGAGSRGWWAATATTAATAVMPEPYLSTLG